MMKMFVRLAVVSLLCVPRLLGAASVSPDSAAGYFFSKPLYPGKISGVVMGSPPEYFTPRSEDADWLSEAIAERMALRNGTMPNPNTVLYPEFGIWSLSETNRFNRWTTAVDAAGVTNIVVGFHLVTNSPPMGTIENYVGTYYLSLASRLLGVITYGRFLDGDEPLSSTARVAFDNGYHQSFTNETYIYQTTNIVTNAFSTISMPMTNGTVSVHTNSWSHMLTDAYQIPVTSVVQATYLDYCHLGNGPFPAFTNYPAIKLLATPSAQTEVIGAMYETLIGLVRLSEISNTTNLTPNVIAWDSISGYVTNSPVTYAWYEYSSMSQKTYSWNSESHSYDESTTDYAFSRKTPEYIAIAPTTFESLLVTTGGAERVKIEAAFAVVDFQYTFETQTDGEIPNLNFETITNLHKDVVVPLASAALDTSETFALARVTLDAESLCGAAASAVGVNQPPSPGQSIAPAGERISWDAKCSKIVLIYKLNPTSKFTSVQ